MIDARCSLVANLWVTPTQRRLPSPSQPPLNDLQQANEPKRRETFAKSAFLWGDGGRRNRPQRRVHRLRWPAMTNGSPPVRFGGVRFTGLRKGLEHARFRCPGSPQKAANPPTQHRAAELVAQRRRGDARTKKPRRSGAKSTHEGLPRGRQIHRYNTKGGCTAHERLAPVSRPRQSPHPRTGGEGACPARVLAEVVTTPRR
jgi:hypothetical protein